MYDDVDGYKTEGGRLNEADHKKKSLWRWFLPKNL